MRKKRKVSARNNKGLSSIVATLLLILLVMAAAGVIWVVINSILKSGSQGINLNQFTFDLSVKSAYVSGSNIVVIISRNAGGGDLSGIELVFTNNTQNFVIPENVSIQQLGLKTFTLASSQIPGIGAGNTVSVAPVYLSSSGSQIIGNPTDTATISGTPPSGSGGGTGTSGTGTCGDSQIENPNSNGVYEQCDGINMGNVNCMSFGYSGGNLGCTSQCIFDFSQCTGTSSPSCGNGICESGENSASCPVDCTSPGGAVCGNGICESTETAISCAADCAPKPSCNGTWTPGSETPGVVCDGGYKCLPTCQCPLGFTPDNLGGCTLSPPINSGSINSVWNSIYFDSQNLPKNGTVRNYIGDYANFSSSPEIKCFQITFADYLSSNNISYLRLDNSVSSPNISAGQGYKIWQAANCGQ